MTVPTSGSAVAYTTDVNVPYGVDCTPMLPTGTVPTSPSAVFTSASTGQAHPEMVVGTPTVSGNIVTVVLSGLAVGVYALSIEFFPSPPGATGEKLTTAPVIFTVPT